MGEAGGQEVPMMKHPALHRLPFDDVNLTLGDI
jgi:hypothetical protein